MGYFSWITNDEDQSISVALSSAGTRPVVMLDELGNEYIETNYQGNGEFDGIDFYELMARMNNITVEKAFDVFHERYEDDLECGKYITPAFLEIDSKIKFHECFPAIQCVDQGFFYDNVLSEEIREFNEEKKQLELPTVKNIDIGDLISKMSNKKSNTEIEGFNFNVIYNEAVEILSEVDEDDYRKVDNEFDNNSILIDTKAKAILFINSEGSSLFLQDVEVDDLYDFVNQIEKTKYDYLETIEASHVNARDFLRANSVVFYENMAQLISKGKTPSIEILKCINENTTAFKSLSSEMQTTITDYINEQSDKIVNTALEEEKLKQERNADSGLKV